MYTHIVLFTLKDPADAERVATQIRALEAQIPSLKSIEVGVDDAPSHRSAHVSLITRHDDPAGLAAYAIHPVHQALLTWVKPYVQATQKVDYAS